MNDSTRPLLISTADAARALGVGVSTVKRWVDDGILPAQKTAGGHRKVLLADLMELARRGSFPSFDVARLGLNLAKRRSPDPGSLTEALYSALLAGSARVVSSTLRGGYEAGLAIETLADRVIAPAMHRLGHDWEDERIDVMHEHRGTQLCAGALFELHAALNVRARRERPIAVGGGPERDHYLLATLLAQMVLLDAGWEAVNLGPNTPMASFRKALVELRPRLVWISISHLEDEKQFVREYAQFYKEAERVGTAVAVGGQALNERIRSAIPYTTYGDGLTHLAAFARTLHPPPRRPQRGRPAR